MRVRTFHAGYMALSWRSSLCYRATDWAISLVIPSTTMSLIFEDDLDRFLSSRPRASRPYRHVCRRQIEFASTVEANLVRAAFDREHTAEMTMSAAKNKLEDVRQEFHKSSASSRCPQLSIGLPIPACVSSVISLCRMGLVVGFVFTFLFRCFMCLPTTLYAVLAVNDVVAFCS